MPHSLMREGFLDTAARHPRRRSGPARGLALDQATGEALERKTGFLDEPKPGFRKFRKAARS
jgi:hypothetical protein